MFCRHLYSTSQLHLVVPEVVLFVTVVYFRVQMHAAIWFIMNVTSFTVVHGVLVNWFTVASVCLSNGKVR